MEDLLEKFFPILVFLGIFVFPKIIASLKKAPGDADLDHKEDYTPLPPGMTAREKGVPPLTSPDRAKYELQRTKEKLQRQKQQAQVRRQAREVARRLITEASAPKRTVDPVGVPPASEAEPSFEGSSALESVMETMRQLAGLPPSNPPSAPAVSKPSPSASKKAMPIKAVPPIENLHLQPVVSEASVAKAALIREVRTSLQDPRRLRQAVLLSEILSPPLSQRAPDFFLKFPHER